MDIIQVLRSKFTEYGIIAEPFQYTYRGIKIVIDYLKQADNEWLSRLKILQIQLYRHFGITMTFDEPWNQYKRSDIQILRVAVAKRNPEILEPKFINSDNPLLNPVNGNWRGLIPFDKIKLEHFMPAIREGIKTARKVHEIIASYPEEPTFYNTFGHRHDDLEILPEPNLDYIESIFSIYMNLCMSDETIELAKKIEAALTVYRNSIMFDRRIYDRALAINAERYNHPLKINELRILNEVLHSGKDAGYDLSKEDQESLKKYKAKLSQLRIDYKGNMTNATNAVLLTVDDLPGLPERSKQNMKKGDKYNITLQEANFSDILEYCTDRHLREEVFKARNTRCYGGKFDNRKNCIEIVNTKLGIAKLLGYKNTAQKVLGYGRMRHNANEVFSLIGSMVIPAQEATARELKELKEFIKSKEGENFDPEPWDLAYYSRLLEESKFNINQEEIRKYFSFTKILQGVFWLAKELYNLDYKKVENAPVYEEGVEVYEIYRGKQYMGMLYVDPFMRDNKSGGAYCSNIISQGICNLGPRADIRPVTLIMTNFDHSGKLSFDEVQTLLHEFGHSLMEALSEVEYGSQSGNNVFWDYVELASQFMENFAYEKEFLTRFATDDEGNVIPQEYIESLKAKANFMTGHCYLRQLEFCYLDLAWFCKEDYIPEENLDIVGDIEKMALIDIPDGRGGKIKQLRIPEKKYYEAECHSTAFSHIFTGGYTAGYYSYINAEVLAADAFDAFGKDPIHNKEVADRFRRYILSAGDTEDPMELYKKFRGSEPGVEALLKQRGLL